MKFDIIGPITAVEVIAAGVHWYEAHGIGKKEFKFKRPLNLP